MKTHPFVFLRATFFRWAGQIEALCPDLADAPAVLSLGDAHIENFGTWYDDEGRLVWGVYDFDEVAEIAYPFDLVRLAIPRRTYTQSHIDYVIEVIEYVASTASELTGYRIIDEPGALRHFTATFEPLR